MAPGSVIRFTRAHRPAHRVLDVVVHARPPRRHEDSALDAARGVGCAQCRTHCSEPARPTGVTRRVRPAASGWCIGRNQHRAGLVRGVVVVTGAGPSRAASHSDWRAPPRPRWAATSAVTWCRAWASASITPPPRAHLPTGPWWLPPKPSATHHRAIAGEAPVVPLRHHRGEIVAFDGRCPHRGAFPWTRATCATTASRAPGTAACSAPTPARWCRARRWSTYLSTSVESPTQAWRCAFSR